MKTLLLAALFAVSAAPCRALDASLDADKNGSLEASEIVAGAKASKGRTALQAAREALDHAVKADLDKDGKLSAKELSLHADAVSGDPARVAGAKLAKGDADGDGSLSFAEIDKDAAKLPGDKKEREELASSLKKADADKDGKVSADEYKKWHAAAAAATK